MVVWKRPFYDILGTEKTFYVFGSVFAYKQDVFFLKKRTPSNFLKDAIPRPRLRPSLSLILMEFRRATAAEINATIESARRLAIPRNLNYLSCTTCFRQMSHSRARRIFNSRLAPTDFMKRTVLIVDLYSLLARALVRSASFRSEKVIKFSTIAA